MHAYVHCASAVKYVQVSSFELCAAVTRILTLDLCLIGPVSQSGVTKQKI